MIINFCKYPTLNFHCKILKCYIIRKFDYFILARAPQLVWEVSSKILSLVLKYFAAASTLKKTFRENQKIAQKIVLVKPALAFVVPNDSCLETILHMIVAQLSALTFLCSYSCISIERFF